MFRQRVEEHSYHGYGIQNFLDIDPRFGTRRDLIELVDAAHALNPRMNIVLDIIFNYSGCNWFYDTSAGDGYKPPFRPTGSYSPVWRRNGYGTAITDPAQALGSDDYVWPRDLQDPSRYLRAGSGNLGAGDIDARRILACVRIDAVTSQQFYHRLLQPPYQRTHADIAPAQIEQAFAGYVYGDSTCGQAALYRVDVFLVAFDPGPGWRYFPSLGEIEYGKDRALLRVHAVSSPPRSRRSSGRSLPTTCWRSRLQVTDTVWRERTVRRRGSAACRSSSPFNRPNARQDAASSGVAATNAVASRVAYSSGCSAVTATLALKCSPRVLATSVARGLMSAGHVGSRCKYIFPA